MLFACVLVQVLVGALAARAYLVWNHTLEANGRWISTKIQVERSLMGSFAFVRERQSLAGGVLNLGAWHGFQEVVYHQPARQIASLEFDFQLEKHGRITALFGRDAEGGASAVRFGTVSSKPSAFLEIAPDGGFDDKQLLRRTTVEPDTWHRARLTFEPEGVAVQLGDAVLGSFVYEPRAGHRVGFRGSRKRVLIDNISASFASGDGWVERFDPPSSLGLALAFSTALAAIVLTCFVVLSRATRADQRTLALGLLAASLIALVSVALLSPVLRLRAKDYPRTTAALEQAEERLRQETTERRIAEIRKRYPVRARAGSGEGTGAHRILFLGTSQTWGSGARSESETFVARVESILNARATDGQRFECINAGFSALRAADLVPILSRDLLPLGPELMLVNLGSNDRSTLEGFDASVRELAETAGRAGVRTVLIQEANEPGSAAPNLIARLAEMKRVGAEIGLPVIDMHGHLRGLHDTGFLWWDHVHLTSYGQRLVAEKLAEEIERLRQPHRWRPLGDYVVCPEEVAEDEQHDRAEGYRNHPEAHVVGLRHGQREAQHDRRDDERCVSEDQFVANAATCPPRRTWTSAPSRAKWFLPATPRSAGAA